MGLQRQTQQGKLIAIWSCRPEDTSAQDWEVTTALWTPAARGWVGLLWHRRSTSTQRTEQAGGHSYPRTKSLQSLNNLQVHSQAPLAISGKGGGICFAQTHYPGHCNTLSSVSCRQVFP